MVAILKTTQIQEPSSATVNLTLDTLGNASFAGMPYGASSFLRNRIINGDMRIDQRNAGAAVTANNSYPVDRFFTGYSTSGAVSSQQSTSVVPSGFTYSTGVTVTTADSSVGAADYVFVEQRIEGYNVADFGFGAAGASTITISFKVRSSVTGTYCIALLNSAGDRSYVAEYTILSANTWETKTITVAGDTSGTWLTTNGIGLRIRFALMAGSSFQQSAASWGTANAVGSSNQVNWMATLNNTFYITGVQLEVGSVATPFERRLYGQELALCQRYYQKWGGDTGYERIGLGQAYSTTQANINVSMLTPMRTTPSFSTVGNLALTGTANATLAATAVANDSSSSQLINLVVSVASGLTDGRATQFCTNNSTAARFQASAEL
jgi:hypothetical protein